MATKKWSKPSLVVANYFASSDEDQQEIENLELPDFEPFMASFRRYRAELSKTEKQQLMHQGLFNTSKKTLIVDIIRKMFDFDLEMEVMEKEVFFVKEKLELILNFIYIAFQHMEGPIVKNVASMLKKMNELKIYYDKKSTLNSALETDLMVISIEH